MLSALSCKSKCLYRPIQQCVRTYAVTMRPSHVYPNKRYPRTFSSRKNYLLHCYRRFLDSSAPVLFLNYANFNTQEMIKLRRSIAAVKPTPQPPSLSDLPASVQGDTMNEAPQLMVVKSTILSVALRERLGLTSKQKKQLARLASGGSLFVLTLPSLHPPHLTALLRTLDTVVPPKRPPLTPQELKAAEEAARLAVVENPTPGRRQKTFKTPLPPELELKGAMIEGRLFVKDALQNVSLLPTLDTLRGQLLGLICGPAMQLAGILNEAGGGQLARTLEGFRRGLEMTQEGDQKDTPAPLS